MVHRRHAGHRSVHGVVVGQVAEHKLRHRRDPLQVGPQTHRQIVEHADAPAASRERLHQVRADKSRPAGDEHGDIGELFMLLKSAHVIGSA